MAARQQQQKFKWVDSSEDDDNSHNPQYWAGNVPAHVRGKTLTPTKVRAIRQLYHSGEFTQAQLTEMFDTSTATINHIVQRKTWDWLD